MRRLDYQHRADTPETEQALIAEVKPACQSWIRWLWLPFCSVCTLTPGSTNG